ncbi:hypothetical protein GA707_17405 [Nostocoides sp. F2B08]|uniref:hypothetical protein n=1 Tax=Nostocoides sp. F2B08 TaxID=2653936 RepID=UPI001262D8D4|nr:hypothetical protein [Tetrasphaera sp. F2B08]KAB7741969.1 hypothetical protein GA707_17405 [Tetrasphaera sp. F2B08]
MGTRRAVLTSAGLIALSVTGCGDAGPAPGIPSGAETFEVPTYDWTGDGMDALVTGRLAFTDDGCTLIYQSGQEALATPVVFPDAQGVRFANGVRAVIRQGSGEVFAVEGEEFSYGGGWVTPGEAWTEPCGAYSGGDLAWINDEPAHPAPTADPPPPPEPVPTRAASAGELGWYAVPTFSWDPAQGGDQALIEGTVTMTADGCATVVREGEVVGLVLPNARGKRDPDGDDAMILSSFPDGTETNMAMHGDPVSFAGSATEDSGPVVDQWTTLCPESPVDGLFIVQDTQP